MAKTPAMTTKNTPQHKLLAMGKPIPQGKAKPVKSSKKK